MYSYRLAVHHSSKLFDVSSVCLDAFSNSCGQRTNWLARTFPQRLTGGSYANVLQDELPELLENVPLQKRRQMYYQHGGAPPHFSQVVRQYLNHKFPKRWIGRGGAQNWPSRSPDLNPLDYHVWGYMKAMVCAHKVNTREELLQRILSAAGSINNAAVLRRVTSSLATRVRKCIQTDGGHFEQFAWVLNGQSVVVK